MSACEFEVREDRMIKMSDDLTGCGKGCCMRKATRLATYRVSGGLRTTRFESCDEHGTTPAEDLPQAAEARAWNRENDYWLDGEPSADT